MTDAFLVGGVRTPFGRYCGALADSRPDDLAALVLAAALERAGVPHDAVDEVIFGAANQAGEDNRNVARMAALLAGLPDEVPGYTVNRLCASSLQAVASAAQQIRAGEADVVVAGGVESMTRAPMVLPKSPRPWAAAADVADTTLGWRLVNPKMNDLDGGKATITLGETAEEVALLDAISREDSDAWGLRSQQLTAANRERLALDFVAVETRKGEVTEDELPRADADVEAMARLKPAFAADGVVTAGSASPLADGASAIVVASADAVERHGLAPRANRGIGLGRRAAARHGARPGALDAQGPRALGLGDRRSRRRGDQRGLRDAGHRDHPPPRARRGDRQHLWGCHRGRPSPRRVGHPARARPPAAPRGRRPQARPGHPLHRRRAGNGAHRRARLRAP
jgi:acetyl-CoA acetyltransferase family protein